MNRGDLLLRAKAHLAHNRMTYWQHFRFAAGHGVGCLKAAALLIAHALAPCFFPRAGSKLVEQMSRDFVEHHIGTFIKRNNEPRA